VPAYPQGATVPAYPKGAATPARPPAATAPAYPAGPGMPHPAAAAPPDPDPAARPGSAALRPGAAGWIAPDHLTHPVLGDVARAMQPVLSRAADLAETAWGGKDEAPPAAVSNTFNVNVALGTGIGPAEREALQDALVDLLRDAARRQGLDI
jgi:hypothetical protein